MQNPSQVIQTTSAPTSSAHTTSSLPTNSVPNLIPPRTTTPKPIAAHPGSRPPIPNPTTKTESPQPTPLSDPVIQKGKKREHEDSVFVSPIQQQQKSQTAAIVGAKAGVNGTRPRPLKKQRMVSLHFINVEKVHPNMLLSRCRTFKVRAGTFLYTSNLPPKEYDSANHMRVTIHVRFCISVRPECAPPGVLEPVRNKCSVYSHPSSCTDMSSL
jgi:hypothetical protein